MTMIVSKFKEHIHKQMSSSSACAIMDICSQDFSTPFNTQELPQSYSGMILCKKGAIHVDSGRANYEMCAISVMPIISWQSYTFSKASNFEGKILLFDSIRNGLMLQGDDFCKMLLSLLCNPVIKLSNEQFVSIMNIVHSIEILNNNVEVKSYNLAIQHILSSILYIAHNDMRANNQIYRTGDQDNQALIFQKFIQLVTQNYKRERRLIFYAQQICITPRYLSRVVKEISGHSASDWIDILITNEILYQIRFSNRSIQQIAYEMGFPNQSFFGKYFKSHIGYSPKEYRRMQY